MSLKAVAISIVAIALSASQAAAEVGEVRLARQPSLGHLPLMIMEDRKLLEQNAAKLGVAGLKARYITLAGGAAMNDALLSGAIQFAAGGVPPFVLLWAKTQNSSAAVKGAAAMNSMPLLLNTTNPTVKTVKDFTEKDKIALPAVKVSIQAIILQMAAEKALGEDKRNALDKYTVTLSHTDGYAALLAKREITAHFTAAPLQELELRQPGVRTVLNSFDVFGGPSTFNVVWSTSSFMTQNPKVYEAFTTSLRQAIEIINSNKDAAAQDYVRLAKDGSDVELIKKILYDPQVKFTPTPQGVETYARFMAKIGMIKSAPSSWKDMFFENVHGEQGN